MAFADAVLSVAQPDDLIWVHDYHLMLTPYYLRQKLSETTIAWFLHTPWPSSEVYRMLPASHEILRGLLSCDMVGFHTWVSQHRDDGGDGGGWATLAFDALSAPC